MNRIRLEIKWALIFVCMMLLWMLLERLFGLHDKHIDKHPLFTNFIAIPSILVYIFALREKKLKFFNGQMNFIQGFICGLIITAIVTAISPITQYITSTFITSDYFSNAIKYAVEHNKSTQADADAFFNLSNYIRQGLIGAPVMGIITSAIVAFFMKSKI